MATLSLSAARAIVIALAVTIQTMPFPAHGGDLPTPSVDARIKASIQVIKAGDVSQRGTAANFLTENWQKALPALVAEVGAYDHEGTKAPTDQELMAVVPLTDALRAILVNKDGAIQTFRTTDGKDKAVRTLIWGARSDNRALRLNSTYSLANVTDNTTLCYVLDHLQDKTLSGNGRTNLLQVALPVAGYAYQENYVATNKTIETVRDIMNTSKENFDQTKKLVDDLQVRIEKSINKDEKLPAQISACARYDWKFDKAR